MRVGDIRALRGPNVYSHRPVLSMRLYLDELAGKESREFPGFNELLLELLPGLAKHHCEGEYVRIPRIEWGVGMADKTITTGLCPCGRLRIERLLRALKTKRVDPTAMTSHTLGFDEMERAFEVAYKNLDDVVKALITS